MANTEVERYTGVDVEDVPSANWGWSKENHLMIQIGGILAGIFMLLHAARQPRRQGRGLLPRRLRAGDLRHRRPRLVAAPPRVDPLALRTRQRQCRT